MQTSAITPAKGKYKVVNWKAYNASLCRRGDITLWIDSSVLREWRDIDLSRKVVGEKQYPDSVILTCLTLCMQHHFALRQTTGFVRSLLKILGYGEYAVPDYTTLSRRQSELPVEVSQRWHNGEKIAIAIDSTGLKVFGEGEWKIRKHGVSKRRTWRKLHIGIDLDTQEIVSVALTGNDDDDAAVAVKMLKEKVKKLKSFSGDGAYDDFSFREILGDVKQIIPPPKDAIVHKGTKKAPLKDYLIQRNEAVEFIEGHDRKQWKIKEDYHRRSLNETVMFRYKTAFGGQVRARKKENQSTEVKIKCKILNVYKDVGMPISYKVA